MFTLSLRDFYEESGAVFYLAAVWCQKEKGGDEL